jgi:predicted CopG family antitoxin
MKLNQLKEEIRSIIKERSVNSIRKAQDKNFKDIEIALDAYKKAKAEGKDLKKFVDILKKLGNDKKSLEKELFGAVSGLYKDAEYQEESVNESSFVKGKTYGGTKCEGGCYVGKQGLMKLIKISKDNPNNVFMFRDDNYSGIQPHFIKNGVIAIAKTINPSYDLERNKVRNLKIGNDVILSVRLFESVNESIDEATTSWSRMMQDVRKGGSGPWSLVGIENNKVVAQKNNIKDKNLLPAHFEAIRRENPKAKIHIEDAGGQVVWNEKK